MRRLLALLSLAATCAAVAPDVFGDWPRVAITYPAPNTTFTSALTPTITLQASAADPDESIVGVAFFVCVASGSACSGTPGIAGGASNPYQVQWTPPLALTFSQAAATVSCLVWAYASNSHGHSTNSAGVPVTVV